FQDPTLDVQLTAQENLDFHAAVYDVPSGQARTRGEQLLRMVELWDRRKDLVRTYSGGMRRRLEIARGLLHSPKVLFLDEPTIGLNRPTLDDVFLKLTGRAIREEEASGQEFMRTFARAFSGGRR